MVEMVFRGALQVVPAHPVQYIARRCSPQDSETKSDRRVLSSPEWKDGRERGRCVCRLRSGQGIYPAHAREAPETRIRGVQTCLVLDSQRRQVSIRRQIAPSTERLEQSNRISAWRPGSTMRTYGCASHAGTWRTRRPPAADS